MGPVSISDPATSLSDRWVTYAPIKAHIGALWRDDDRDAAVFRAAAEVRLSATDRLPMPRVSILARGMPTLASRSATASARRRRAGRYSCLRRSCRYGRPRRNLVMPTLSSARPIFCTVSVLSEFSLPMLLPNSTYPTGRTPAVVSQRSPAIAAARSARASGPGAALAAGSRATNTIVSSEKRPLNSCCIASQNP